MPPPLPCIIDHPSPSHDARPANAGVDMVILHYTGMPTGEAALTRLCDPSAKVSAHYLIEEDGRLFRLVDEDRRAWHAGVSRWQDCDNCNHVSIGIELVNPGHEFGYRPFPSPQIDTVLALLSDIQGRWSVPASRFVGHSDVAPARKADPGPLFPWDRLARHGFGLWSAQDGADPTPLARTGDRGAQVAAMQERLGALGYGLKPSGLYDHETEAVVRAFQMHWRPNSVTGVFDRGSDIILKDVLDRAQVRGGTGQF